jgi:sec-independent protein translocase protein TatB
MFGLNWPELMIISVVALIVIGPEDLPKMFRELGRFTAKLRQMSREFSRAMEQAAKETGVSDVAKDLKSATSAKSLGLDAVKDQMDKFEKWDPLKNAAKPSAPMPNSTGPARSLVPPPMPATPTKPDPIDEIEAEEDLAEALLEEALEASAAEAKPHGTHTQALYDKAALRAQVLAEQTEKLKAIEAGTYQPAPKPAETKTQDMPLKGEETA